MAETGGTKKACSSPEEAHGDSMHVCLILIQPEVAESLIDIRCDVEVPDSIDNNNNNNVQGFLVQS